MRKKKNRQTSIPVGSFSDIAFLLIIFFILTTTLTKEKGFLTDFPSGEVNTKKSSEKNATVVLTTSDIRLNGEPVTIEKLREKLHGMKLWERETMEDRMVIMEAQGSMPYQQYYAVRSSMAQASGTVAVVKESKL